MVNDENKFLIELGLSEEKALQTLKNNQLTQILKDFYNEIKQYSNVSKTNGVLIYNLAAKIKPQIKDKAPVLIEYIGLNKITNDSQLNAAIDYFLSAPNMLFDKSKFETSCGVGVFLTLEDIENEVTKVITSNLNDLKIQRYKFNTGILIGEIKKNLRWADGKAIKNEIDLQLFKLLGPKSDVDLEDTYGNKVSKISKYTNGDKNKDEKQDGFKLTLMGDNYLDFYKTINFHKPGDNFKTDGYVFTNYTFQLLSEHLKRTGGKVITRFPPEPNGVLHLGHAKAININFGYAKANNGICYLRYDDTNPEKEEERFFTGIEEMVRWLGYSPYKITHSSDYFDHLYECAVKLIRKGKAYVCHQTADDTKGFTSTVSPYRSRTVSQNQDYFEAMRKGEFKEGSATLRMKTTLEEGKVDPIAYRIKMCPHPRTGYSWCIYPTYDFTHCLCDSFEDITHSLCTKEFQSRRSSYYWLLNSLNLYCPVQWEYGRLNVSHSVVSKRKIAKLIEQGIVRDWDDPRLYTLTALRRKGYPPTAINKFCVSLGVTTALVTVDIEMLESFVRYELNETAQRTMAVLEPLKIHITNWDEIKLLENGPSNLCKVKGDDGKDWIEILVPNFPSTNDITKGGKHTIRFGQNIYIERDDFKEDADKSYRRFTPNQSVGLRYANVALEVLEIAKFPNKDHLISQIKVKASFIRPDNKPKAFIHWVSDPSLCEVRLYEKLFLHKNPDNLKEVPKGYLTDINPDSMKSISYALIDKYVIHKFGTEFFPLVTFQFERLGYFCIDPDSKAEKLVFNRSVTLKEDSKK